MVSTMAHSTEEKTKPLLFSFLSLLIILIDIPLTILLFFGLTKLSAQKLSLTNTLPLINISLKPKPTGLLSRFSPHMQGFLCKTSLINHQRFTINNFELYVTVLDISIILPKEIILKLFLLYIVLNFYLKNSIANSTKY